MEVQSFVLCHGLSCDANKQFTLISPFHTIEAVRDDWPLRFDPCFYLMLRRSVTEARMAFSLLFNLIDQDGIQIPSPEELRFDAAFGEGRRVVIAAGKFFMEFPRRGSYRLDVSILEPITQSLYGYDICVE
jgi:hypothetical protein